MTASYVAETMDTPKRMIWRNNGKSRFSPEFRHWQEEDQAYNAYMAEYEASGQAEIDRKDREDSKRAFMATYGISESKLNEMVKRRK